MTTAMNGAVVAGRAAIVGLEARGQERQKGQSSDGAEAAEFGTLLEATVGVMGDLPPVKRPDVNGARLISHSLQSEGIDARAAIACAAMDCLDVALSRPDDPVGEATPDTLIAFWDSPSGVEESGLALETEPSAESDVEATILQIFGLSVGLPSGLPVRMSAPNMSLSVSAEKHAQTESASAPVDGDGTTVGLAPQTDMLSADVGPRADDTGERVQQHVQLAPQQFVRAAEGSNARPTLVSSVAEGDAPKASEGPPTPAQALVKSVNSGLDPARPRGQDLPPRSEPPTTASVAEPGPHAAQSGRNASTDQSRATGLSDQIGEERSVNTDMRVSVIKAETHLAPTSPSVPVVSQLSDAITTDLSQAMPAKPSGSTQHTGAPAPLATSPIVRTLELHLEPRELGPVTVRMSISDTSLRIALKVRGAAVADQIEANRHELAKALGDAGCRLDELIVQAVTARTDALSPSTAAGANTASQSGGQASTSGYLSQGEAGAGSENSGRGHPQRGGSQSHESHRGDKERVPREQRSGIYL